MHPKQMCSDVESMGAKLVLDGEDLFIEQPEKVPPEVIGLIKEYKNRIIKYLKGSYSDKEHSVRQTIDKIIDFYHKGCPVDSKINKWLQQDIKALELLLILWRELYDNGWSYSVHICNFENEKTVELSKQIYDRAMHFFKKGAVME
ncbi:hypothetical protein FZC78_19280 [Rossellomorea vietnamensis]|uniref:Uncharacterized protein n=1 Tax=Rossellomorea vietnamensis TaxID=218284 RepID=A0A5D4NLB9_9BACI|nr:hypothetical protein [Rossellomorea vietnamensis]TYS14298.1 hypothetical protein FZC78_19280 [Rossellomorea vietnamensis]